ncbi:ApeA N-terminal domain 1-containing protein [Shewanella surugensis]|uniref:ApeA N-terminal domain-containing protein n=1 Tax=Shewanella surugensis TaxID=212020 RepID=A0ABT0LGB9_9GAMM|nr:HEPN domain-containing protein [Shewanella surugensis]MCL1126728.1 hypothetical protein [Shewanella surugensis]
MTKEIYSCFENYEFFGEFFADIDCNSGRFSGKIKYSPENGLQLEYCLSDNGAPSSCDRLFGILNNGKLCTLVGPFDFESGTHHHGKVLVKSGLHGFYYLLIDSFVEKHETVKLTHFTFNGMQEFIHPQGSTNQLKYQLEPILTTNGNNWELEVENTATHSMVGDNLINLIDSNDQEAKEKLELALKKIKNDHPQSSLYLRKSLKYAFKYKSEFKLNAEKTIDEITKIAGLFSILLSCPKFPEEMFFYFDDNKKQGVHVLNSICLEHRTIRLAQKEISHQMMPLNWKQLDMKIVLSRWFDLYDDFQVISVSHQYETGFRTLHYTYSDIILYSTQLEAINKDLGGESKEKYAKPIEMYASIDLKLKLETIFKKINKHELGSNISTLRNELAHVGIPKNMMKKLSIEDYMEIGHVLKLIVVAHLLKKLDISKDNINQYQNRLIS